MGGHGALICGLKNFEKFTSISAFSPISNPSNCPWGIKAFSRFFNSENEWEQYDATKIAGLVDRSLPILIDMGSDDQFLKEKQLLPDNFIAASKHLNVTYNLREDYDHSYFFVASFVENHFDFHSQFLK